MIRMLFAVLLVVFVGMRPGISVAHSYSKRVVSINLCTDQLAMLMADRDQLLSVSRLAYVPNTSLMVDTAQKFIMNHGNAEEIIRLRPDLVLAGIYTPTNTINLLKRFGIPVAQFAPDRGFDDIRENIKRLGALLGQQKRAARMIMDFDNKLAAVKRQAPTEPKVLATFEPNSYTGGSGTLANEMIEAAGVKHLGAELGFQGSTVKLPLEQLIRDNPDYVMTWAQWSGGSARATQILSHPALDKWFGPDRRISVDTRYWICGGPFTVDAVANLQEQIRQKEKGN